MGLGRKKTNLHQPNFHDITGRCNGKIGSIIIMHSLTYKKTL